MNEIKKQRMKGEGITSAFSRLNAAWVGAGIRREVMTYLFTACALALSTPSLAQSEGDVIINEIANIGSKKAMYTGGVHVELLVVKKEGEPGQTTKGSPNGSDRISRRLQD